jgi:hypothetical protein
MERGEGEKEIGGMPGSQSHGGVGLDSFDRYAGSSTKTREAGVYDGGGAHGLPCARGPCVPLTCGRICGVLHGILRVRIRYSIASVPPLIVMVL